MAVTDQAPALGAGAGPAQQTARLFVNIGLVLTVIAFALVMALGATYWRWLGYA